MMPTHFARCSAFAALLVLGATTAALAQSPTPSPFGPSGSAPGMRPRIEVNPAPRLLYRRCTSWLELQYRPSGTVVYPARHCWWVRG
jgi:hypothetical protein